MTAVSLTTQHQGPGTLTLSCHRLRVALLHPRIAPNTGNIGRLCVASGTELHLIRPLGFVLSDRELKRSAMDYWARLRLTLHDDLDAYLAAMADARIWCFTSKARRSLWQADFADGDCLLFGSETTGLPEEVAARDLDRAVRIPQAEGERCLNLSTAAGIGLYEALRQVQMKR
jgi:tRNA (cytidine/uridine-2'-O-)-methyltransferase